MMSLESYNDEYYKLCGNRGIRMVTNLIILSIQCSARFQVNCSTTKLGRQLLRSLSNSYIPDARALIGDLCERT